MKSTVLRRNRQFTGEKRPDPQVLSPGLHEYRPAQITEILWFGSAASLELTPKKGNVWGRKAEAAPYQCGIHRRCIPGSAEPVLPGWILLNVDDRQQ